jgi:hypothetical protein
VGKDKVTIKKIRKPLRHGETNTLQKSS